MTEIEQQSYDCDSIESQIRITTGSLLMRQPFFGYLVSKMTWKDEPSISTMGVDGRTIYYNEGFFRSLSRNERVFLIAHEIMHCVLNHVGYYGNRKTDDHHHMLWNMAADYAVNYILVKNGVGEMPKQGLHDIKYADMFTEEIYEDLVKEGKAAAQTLDDHSFFEGKDGDGESSAEESEARAKEFQQSMVEAYQVAKEAGKIPQEIESIIKELVEPKINWKTLLQRNIQSIFKNEQSWFKPNRRSVNGFIFPSNVPEDTVDLCVSIDTSGSISEEMKVEFLSEICGLLDHYTNFKLKIWCFDTSVHAFKEYDLHNIQELPDYVLKGGGGTEIACNYNFMESKGIIPKQLVVLTDAYNGSSHWGDPQYCPVTWIIHSNRNPDVPFGNWTLYERN